MSSPPVSPSGSCLGDNTPSTRGGSPPSELGSDVSLKRKADAMESDDEGTNDHAGTPPSPVDGPDQAFHDWVKEEIMKASDSSDLAGNQYSTISINKLKVLHGLVVDVKHLRLENDVLRAEQIATKQLRDDVLEHMACVEIRMERQISGLRSGLQGLENTMESLRNEASDSRAEGLAALLELFVAQCQSQSVPRDQVAEMLAQYGLRLAEE